MDFGDIIRLLFLLFIFLTFFGGVFGRNREGGEQRRRPRPTDVFESGGPDRPRPTATVPRERRAEPASHEQQWENETLSQPNQHREEIRARYQQPEVFTYDDAVERGDGRTEARREELTERFGGELDRARQAVLESERQMLEGEISDMPEPRGARPLRGLLSREIGGSTTQRRRRRTGGDVLRQSLKQPETLERAFILKEVVDEPLSLRRRR